MALQRTGEASLFAQGMGFLVIPSQIAPLFHPEILLLHF